MLSLGAEWNRMGHTTYVNPKKDNEASLKRIEHSLIHKTLDGLLKKNIAKSEYYFAGTVFVLFVKEYK